MPAVVFPAALRDVMMSPKRWEEAAREAEVLTDRLGKPIDPFIRPVVSALRAHGFPTTASCQGHLSRGHPYPWIEISPPQPTATDPRAAQEEVRRFGILLRAHLTTFLEGFYSARPALRYSTRLGFHFFPFGLFRLQSVGAEVLPFERAEIRRARITEYRAEAASFGRYLRAEL